jgi:hypothetical protein
MLQNHPMRRLLAKEKQDKEKYAVYMDRGDLKVLRDYQEKVGVPVSESIRRAIRAYVSELKTKS